MTIPTVFETCRPRSDILSGSIADADFAADLTRGSVIRSDDRSRTREFDALYVGTRAVLLNETKAPPRVIAISVSNAGSHFQGRY